MRIPYAPEGGRFVGVAGDLESMGGRKRSIEEEARQWQAGKETLWKRTHWRWLSHLGESPRPCYPRFQIRIWPSDLNCPVYQLFLAYLRGNRLPQKPKDAV